MRKILATAAVLALATGAAQAATMTIALGVGQSTSPSSAGTSINTTSGATLYVFVFAKTDTLQNPSSNNSIDASGNGFQDESAGDDNSGNPQTIAGGIRSSEVNVTDASLTASKFTFASTISSNFTKINGTVATGQAIAYGFGDASSYNDTVLGTPASTTLMTSGPFTGYDEIGYATTTVGTTSSTAVPSTTGLSYWYDSTNGAQNFDTSYSPASIVYQTATVTVPAVPEPASLSLLGLGALGLIARRRRA